MPGSVAGHFNAVAGATEKTQQYMQMPTLKDSIGALDVQNHPAFTSINESTAYFQHLKKSLVELNTADFFRNPTQAYYEHIVRYIMVSGMILMSGMRDDIECKVSYIRINDDALSPYKPDPMFPASSKAFKEVLDEWAEFIDPNLEASDSGIAAKIRMLCVVSLNDVPVAYYSPDNIMFYPFKTITSPAEKAKNFPGVTVNADNKWEFNLPKFQASCQAPAGYLSFVQQQILASKLNTLNGQPGRGKGFSVIMHVLGLNLPAGAVLPAYTDVPVKMSVYTKPGNSPSIRPVDSKEIPLLNAVGHLLAVPMEMEKAKDLKYTPGSLSRDIYQALGYAVPNCTIFTCPANGTQWLMVSEVDNCTFHYAGKPLGKTGTAIVGAPLAVPPAGSINLDVIYLFNTLNPYPLGTITFPCSVTANKITFDESNQRLSYFIGGLGNMLNPFVPKLWKNVDNLLPVKKQFVEVIKACEYHLSNPVISTDADGNTQVKITILNSADITIETISHTYPKNYVIENGEEIDFGAGNIAPAVMPQLSVYPYHRFEDINGTSVWNNYFFAAMIDVPEAYKYFRSLEFTYGNNIPLELNKEPKNMLSKDANSYIGYRTQASVIPDYIFICDNQKTELGVITIPEPPVTIVDPASTAIVGIDMGSRNSIVATYNVNAGTINYIYSAGKLQGKDLNYIFCNYPTESADWDERCNMFGTPTGVSKNCEDSFISSVLDYINIVGQKYEPYAHGRLIADLNDKTYQKILNMAKNLKNTTKSPMEEIGLYNGFKEKLYKLVPGQNPAAEVELFIKNACYQMILNAFCEGCGKINFNFTAPDDNTGSILQQIWATAIASAGKLFKIPANIVITPSNYMLESAALFYNISQIGGMHGVHQYAITIDAGDSTFDIALFSYDKNDNAVTRKLNKNFSIKYAGKRLMVESIIEVCKHENVNPAKFVDLWGQAGMFVAAAAGMKKAITAFVDTIIKNTNKGSCIEWNNDSTEDVIYKLIENFGLNVGTADPIVKPIMEKIKSLINLKYCLLLNVILEFCVSILPADDIIDHTITVALYGGTNNVAKLLYPVNTAKALQNLMDGWLKSYKNNPGIENSDVRYCVDGHNSGKKELVSGLVKAKPQPINDKTKKVFDCAEKYSHDTYFNVISQVFPEPENGETSPYWTETTTGGHICTLDIPNIEGIPAVAAHDFHILKADVKKGFLLPAAAPDLNLPDELIYPLQTFFLAIEQFKNANGLT